MRFSSPAPSTLAASACISSGVIGWSGLDSDAGFAALASSGPVAVDAAPAPSLWLASFMRHRQSGARSAPECRSEEHKSELQSLMRISYAVFCLKKKTKNNINITNQSQHRTYLTTNKNITLSITHKTQP